MRKLPLLLLCISLLQMPSFAQCGPSDVSDSWTQINPGAPWAARAGLQAVELGSKIYVLGGRTPIDPATLPFPVPGASVIWGDVWSSSNYGNSWNLELPAAPWAARAYFQALTLGGQMYVIGGQDFSVIPNPAGGFPPFISNSNFFNDVWSSPDGVNWTQQTSAAPWQGRAGLSATVHDGKMWVIGGSFNDDPAIIGGPPTRVYFNDVWSSVDGSTWVQATAAAPWEARAGGIVVSKDGYLWLIGGEEGFTCEPLPFCDPPYFNDVWRSTDGTNWELVTASAPWVKRPGHQVVVYGEWFVLFGGFGLLQNPSDVWISRNGADWYQVGTAPWNVSDPTGIRYDFDALTVRDAAGDLRGILAFGGDRETFDFTDPLNWTRVDNDVWGARPIIADPCTGSRLGDFAATSGTNVYPNPATEVLVVETAETEDVEETMISILDLTGRAHLQFGISGSGISQIDVSGLPGGQYILRLQTNKGIESRSLQIQH